MIERANSVLRIRHSLRTPATSTRLRDAAMTTAARDADALAVDPGRQAEIDDPLPPPVVEHSERLPMRLDDHRPPVSDRPC